VTPSTASASSSGSTRRDFLTAAAVGAGLAALTPAVYAAGSDVLKIGLIGCGGRGTGAATQALLADPNVKLVALGDVFPDRVQYCLTSLNNDGQIAGRIAVTPDTCFSGFDAYKRVIPLCDVVLLATPPHFRPAHLEAAVDAGKHVFCEKPVAVDGPGCRRVLEAARKAKEKNLALVSGLCYRYERAKQEAMKRVHEGAIGDILALRCNYNSKGLWFKKHDPAWSDMEWQIRNWLYFTWLSGDHIVEQHIHSLDKMAWAVSDQDPVSAVGLGGRQVRTGPEYGHIFDHHAVDYEFPNGVHLSAYCRQQDGTYTETSDFVVGSKGTLDVMNHIITGVSPWRTPRKNLKDDMYQNEHDALFASIRAGKPINNGDYMTRSTRLAIMGRMATYTGQKITWDQVVNSGEDLSPAKYEWGPLAVPPVAIPGKTPVR
jgi:predicted dehydrogenase